MSVTTHGQISLPDDASRLLLLMLAGGLGVGAGSALSSFVDVALFRRLLILLMLLGANVMLFAGRPLRTAVVGVCAVSLLPPLPARSLASTLRPRPLGVLVGCRGAGCKELERGRLGPAAMGG